MGEFKNVPVLDRVPYVSADKMEALSEHVEALFVLADNDTSIDKEGFFVLLWRYCKEHLGYIVSESYRTRFVSVVAQYHIDHNDDSMFKKQTVRRHLEKFWMRWKTRNDRATKPAEESARKRKNMETQKAKDPDAFRAKNNRRNKKYRADSESYQASEEANKTSPSAIISVFKAGVMQRQIECTMTDDQILKKMKDPCHYCGDTDAYGYNGLDRQVSSGGYDDDNTVACCEKCNFLKIGLSCDDFLRATRNVYMHNIDNIDLSEFGEPLVFDKVYVFDGVSTTATSHSSFVYRDKSRFGVDCNFLTLHEYNDMVSKACVYCGSVSSIGIDRLDCSEPHTLKNCVPCDTRCNMMRQDLQVDKFLMLCCRVATHYRVNEVIGDSVVCPKLPWLPGHSTRPKKASFYNLGSIKLYTPEVETSILTDFVYVGANTKAYHSVVTCRKGLTSPKKINWRDLGVRKTIRPCHYCRSVLI
jgi:hypothetical protein